MITLEQVITSDVPVPVSFGWTNDLRQIIENIASMSSPKTIELLIDRVGSYRISNGNVQSGTFANEPTVEAVLAQIVSTNSTSMRDTIQIVYGKIEAMSPSIKAFYDNALDYIVENQITASNLITGAESLAEADNNAGRRGRGGRVQEYQMERNLPAAPKLIVLSYSSEMPKNLGDFCFDLGCVDKPNHSREILTSGLNTSESAYIKGFYNLLNPEDDKSKRAKTIAALRKGVFSGSKVIQDIPIVNDISNIGGYEVVKKYYEKRAEYLKREAGTIKIKGDLFVGPPGTGKSVIMTAIPTMLGLPGFQMDINAGLGSLQGQSEQAVKDAISKAKKLAPCVVLIDEIEKVLAGTGEGQAAGNEVAEKILGILLTAMAEKNQIYWVASANRIDHIQTAHPELLRKGRFDNMWYVPLPNDKTRSRIFGIHCRLNGIRVEDIEEDLSEIISLTKDWSGAEIEHVCKEAYVQATADGKIADGKSILKEINTVKGITGKSKLVEALDGWAKINANPVD